MMVMLCYRNEQVVWAVNQSGSGAFTMTFTEEKVETRNMLTYLMPLCVIFNQTRFYPSVNLEALRDARLFIV